MIKFVLIIFLIISVGDSFGENILSELTDKDKNLKILKNEIDKENVQLKKMENTRQSLSARLRNIENNLILHEALLKKINIKSAELKAKQEEISKKIESLNANIAEIKKTISKSNIYIVDNNGILSLKAMVFSRNYHDMIKNMELLEKVNTSLFGKVKVINDKKIEVEKLYAVLNERIDELNKYHSAKASLLNDYQNEKMRYQQTIALIKEDEVNKKEYLTLLQKRSSDMNEKISKSISSNSHNVMEKDAKSTSGFVSLKGSMEWPVKGEIVEKYGPRYVENLKGEIFNKGVKIRVKNDGYVKSVYEGTVKYIDWIRGYGNIIIVNHEDIFYTIYANLDEVFIKSGQKIKKGDKLGLVDVDARNVSPYVYFEIRKQNEAQNPEHWLKKEEY